jgi:hypothetical protein
MRDLANGHSAACSSVLLDAGTCWGCAAPGLWPFGAAPYVCAEQRQQLTTPRAGLWHVIVAACCPIACHKADQRVVLVPTAAFVCQRGARSCDARCASRGGVWAGRAKGH